MEAVCDGCKPAPSKNLCCNCQGSLKKDGLRLADCTTLHRVTQHILELILIYSRYCGKTDLMPPGAAGLLFISRMGGLILGFSCPHVEMSLSIIHLAGQLVFEWLNERHI